MVRTTLDIATGETVSVASGEQLDVATVSNAGTLSNQGTVTTAALELTATAADIDASTAIIADIRQLTATAADIDASTSTATRVRKLEGASADIDASTAIAERVRDLIATAADIDASEVNLERIRELLASAMDVDASTSTVRILVAVDATDPVEAVVTILAGERDILWTGTPPTVKNYWDDSASERGPGADMPAILYVWSPTTTSLERFSVDGDVFDQNDTVEIQAWSLDEQEVIQLRDDIVQILSRYLDDNQFATQYSDLAPTGTNDWREQTPARTTDHYLTSVEVETQWLSKTSKNP